MTTGSPALAISAEIAPTPRFPFHILHSIAGLRTEHGGTSRSVPALCRALLEQGVDVQLVAGSPAAQRSDAAKYSKLPPDRVQLVDESEWFRQWGVAKAFRHAVERSDANRITSLIVHDHGVWLPTNHAVALASRRQGAVRVVSPRGMLSPWALDHGRWKKRVAWLAYQRRDLDAATAFHATSADEAAEIRSLGFKQPIAVISNGVELPPEVNRSERNAGGQRTMLFLSRIHPKKGLLNLVHAWQQAAPSPEWRLVIAGPDDGGHRVQVESLVLELGLQGRITFPGEIGDADKWNWYAGADVFVLPSFSENFGIVVAEALAAGLPVITTTGTPWSDLPRLGMGWHVEPTVQALATTLRETTAQSRDELQSRGAAGAAWVRSEFAWDAVATRMIQYYQWLLSETAPPPFVQ